MKKIIFIISILALFANINAQLCPKIGVSFKYKKDTLIHIFEVENKMELQLFGGDVMCDYPILPIKCKSEKRTSKLSRKLYKKTRIIAIYSGRVIELHPYHFEHYYFLKRETSIYKFFRRNELMQL